jgi:hypothetical protein
MLTLCFLSRDDWIRTSDLFVPNEARYRAALQPVKYKAIFLYLNSKKPDMQSMF